jgi:hypothetical protein
MKLTQPLLPLILCLLVSSCSPPKSDTESGISTPTTPELELCSTSTSYATGVTITGTANFYKRNLIPTITGGVVTQMTLGAPTTTAIPIRFAEIRVLNSAGEVVQCGKTNTSGALKALDGASDLKIPNTAGTYTVQVMSRANHTLSVPGGKVAFKYLSSIKKDLYSNDVYSVGGTVSSNGSGSYSINLTAYARESQSTEVLGGAFNIYNSMLVAYEYLAQNTGTSNLTCMNPKMDVYWRAGFNPAQYLYPSANPNDLGTVSFYVRGENQLFINGGVQGNVSTKDTDHFDDAVIIHELGHHVEDVCGKMDSPGGTHYGLYRIDPRFAWSEGWGNFFGAHILANNLSSINPDLATTLSGASTSWTHYLDTEGYKDGSVNSGSSLIILNLTKLGSAPESLGGGRYYDKVDAGAYPGEGHTREVSISRSLFKGANTCTNCVNASNFPSYWKAIENISSGAGMGRAIYAFRSSSLFFSTLNSVAAGIMANIDTMLNTDEAQQRAGNAAYVSGGKQIWVPYGIKLVNNHGSACTNPLRIQPRNETDTVTDGFSDQRYSNHFFTIDMSLLTGVTSIILTATKVTTAGTETSTDIDLILFKDGYRFNQDCTIDSTTGNCTSYAKNTSSTDMILSDRSTGSPLAGTFNKTITGLDSLSASSFYMLDVRAFTSGRTISATTAYDYTLTTNTGENLCPSATY